MTHSATSLPASVAAPPASEHIISVALPQQWSLPSPHRQSRAQ